MEYREGSIVFNDWVITQKLGEGATGIVFEIEKMDFGISIKSALKVVHIPGASSDVKAVMREGMTEKDTEEYFYGFVEEILKEIKIMVSLKGHPNIVTYEDHCVIPHEHEIGWDILIKMELLTPLGDWLETHSMNEEEVVRLGYEISNALAYTARRGMIHRDVKPGNIFIDRFGKYKLGDFGIARTVEKTTSELSSKGTWSYMAPEVYLRKKYNKQVDIYSLGIVMYRFLNDNRLPFCPPITEKITSRNKEEAFEKRMQGVPVPEPVNGSTELKRIVLKACEYHPQNRYGSIDEMHMDLEQLMTELDEDTTVISPIPAPSGGKKKWFVLIGTATAVVLISRLIFSTYVKDRALEMQLNQMKAENKKDMRMEALVESEVQKETIREKTTEVQTEISTEVETETETEPETETETETETQTELDTEIETETNERIKISNYDQALFYEQCNTLLNVKVGDEVKFGACEQDNNPSNGKEEIEWEVLDKKDNKILIISKKVLDGYGYSDSLEETDWEKSNVRKWLNESFFKDAFSQYHQSLIMDTAVTADKNLDYQTDTGVDTVDKIYLLSTDEVQKYFPNIESRECQATVYAKVKGVSLHNLNTWWWLRTCGKDKKHMAAVYSDGEITSEGYRVNIKKGGIRPAIWLDLSDVTNVEVPQEYFQKQTECKGIVAINPSCVGKSDDRTFMEAVAPGQEEAECIFNPGVTGETTGVKESKVDLEVAKQLQEILLERGYQVVMLREDNESCLSASNRAIAAAEAGADIQVVISCRKRQDLGESGAMAYIPKKDNPSVGYMYEECEKLSQCVLSEYCATGVFENNGIHETDNVKDINWSSMPVTNILLGCIKDSSDEEKLADQNNWVLMAEGIANGIDIYFEGEET